MLKVASYSLGLEEYQEVVCIANSPNRDLLAVGSQHYLVLIDPRTPIPVSRIPSQDLDWGVILHFRFFASSYL
jgi:hypothetical protein